MMGRSGFNRLALALAAGVCLFHLLTLRSGQGWMDDYAQYVLHARNLAEGRPYAGTGYILNPAYQTAGPATYPPVFPLLLAPVYRLAGLNFMAMKALTVFFFAAFLYLLCLLFRGPLGERAALLAAALVGLSPVFWKFKDYLYAEYPFLFFSFAALYAWRLARRAEDGGGRWLPKALAAGALAYLAYGTRSAGAALFPAFIAADLAAGKRFSRTTLACCAAALAPAAAQWLTLHGDRVYAEQARSLLGGPAAAAVLKNLLAYAESAALLFDNGYVAVLPALLLAAFAAAAAAGLVRRAGREPLFAAYALAYAALLLLFPASDGLRYAFPLVPFLFYYAAEGWGEYGGRFGRAARYAPAALLLAAGLSYAGAYSGARYGSFREGTEKKETRELFDFVRREVPPGTPVIFRKPRALALYTGRPAAMYHFAPDDADVLRFFERTRAGYLVAGSVFPEDEAFLKPLVARNKKFFSEVYSNPDFKVYRINH